MGIKKQKGNSGKIIRPTEDKFPDDKFNYPVFCLKHIQTNYSLNDCTKDEKASFVDQLYNLSQLSWQTIQLSPKHGLGTEKIEQGSIKAKLPNIVTPDVKLYALRFDGKKPMVGFKSHFVFHVLYLDRSFSLYNH
jgi:hypothetical protein